MMYSRSLREGLGAIAREAKPPRVDGSVAAAEGVGQGEHRVVRAGIEEILAGGIQAGPHGSLFIHERLYTDLGERPAPLLRKLASLSEPPAENGASATAAATLP